MRSKLTLWLALFGLTFVSAFAYAQQPTPAPGAPAAPAETGKIHGHVQDPATTPMADAQVKLSTDGVTTKYTFNTDQNGDYTGGGIVPGTYVGTLFQTPTKSVDQIQHIVITAGGDTQQDFDLSRADYISKLSPDEQKAIADAKAKNAEINKSNQDVNKLNGMLKEARADDQQKKYDDAATLMQQAVQIKTDIPVLWLELGIAQNGQKKYDDAVVSLKKALDLDTAAKKPSLEIQSSADNALGEAYASSNKIPEAKDAYDAAVKLQPSNAALFYTNEAIVLNRAGQSDGTVAAADQAIAADPTKPIPYYLKGQALISKATVDPKTHLIVAPPGCAEAYEKYLDLDPNGPMAAEVRGVLSGLGTKVPTKYTAPKSH